MKDLDDPEGLETLQHRLGVRFQDPDLLRTALTHSSYIHEVPGTGTDNERLEFLGDAVLGAVVSALAYEAHPGLAEGDLTRLRSAVVRRSSLADLARALGIGDHLRLGRGASQVDGIARSDSALCDAFEALVGAIFLDRGFEEVRRFLQDVLGSRVASGRSLASARDPKSRLQERSLKAVGEVPRYEVLDASGPPHDRRYRVQVTLFDGRRFEGAGRSRREAEQAAAARALVTEGGPGGPAEGGADE
ncbi:MAG TPA: ribonuclease III [Myxococcota bacterium]|nr:ribonuclease III [Myxococcota bacterium]HQK51413.1 ribonuclease III [Myxococcota bacterium]